MNVTTWIPINSEAKARLQRSLFILHNSLRDSFPPSHILDDVARMAIIDEEILRSVTMDVSRSFSEDIPQNFLLVMTKVLIALNTGLGRVAYSQAIGYSPSY